MKITLIILAAVALYLAAAVYASRSQRPERATVPVDAAPPSLAPAIGETLTVSTWNLGYAGLGADSDFLADGGKHLFPPSWRAPRRNLKAILAVAGALDAEVSLYQEVAGRSPLNYWTPLDGRLRDLLADRLYLFQRDIATRLFVWPLRLSHGIVTASRIRPVAAETIPLPLEPGPVMGLINRQYALQVTRFADVSGGSGWTLINLHMSAFDDGSVRDRQLDAAIATATQEYEAGQRVVMGGDWNMALTEHPLARPEDAAILFWLRPFPAERLPEGWQIVAPAQAPTVRTDHKPYAAGDNPVATIDGFVISPNVRAISVDAIDTGFAMSDHQPVVARFAAREVGHRAAN